MYLGRYCRQPVVWCGGVVGTLSQYRTKVSPAGDMGGQRNGAAFSSCEYHLLTEVDCEVNKVNLVLIVQH